MKVRPNLSLPMRKRNLSNRQTVKAEASLYIRAVSPESLLFPQYMGQVIRKILMSYTNNKGTDQPAHLHSLINAFVVCFLGSRISPIYVKFHDSS